MELYGSPDDRLTPAGVAVVGVAFLATALFAVAGAAAVTLAVARGARYVFERWLEPPLPRWEHQ